MSRRLFFFYLFTFLPFYLFTWVKSARAARLYFDPGQKSVEEKTAFNADLWLDTEGKETGGVDVVLEFDVGKVTVETVSFSDIYSNSAVRKKDNANGRLEISAYFTDFSSIYQGKDRLAVIRFKAVSESADVNFVCQSGETTDTNVLEFGGADIVNCSGLGNLRVTISEVSPSPSSSPSPPSDDGGTGGPVDSDGCDKDSPDRPSGLTASSGPGRGQVALGWSKVGRATHYAISYGERWLDFDYGAANVGDTNQFVVNGLKTAVPYYFVVTAVNDCVSSGYSDGAAAYAGWGAAASERQTTSPQDKGWQPPEPIGFKADEEEATEGANFKPSPFPKESPKLYYEPPEPHKPWQDPGFWKKLGWILLILFLLWLLLGFLRRRRKGKRLRVKMEKVIGDVTGRHITGKKKDVPPPPF